MRVLGFALTACLVLSLSACSGKSDKDKGSGSGSGSGGRSSSVTPTAASNAEKIIGMWEVTKGEMPPGSTVEFGKDGKMKMTMKVPGGKPPVSMEATYKVEGDTIKSTMKAGGMEKTETLKIKELTDSKLVTLDEKNTTDEFKKK